MEKYVCIHGHFYQPPRENPWLNEVEIQDSSYPYHDWNERITAECYARNSASRIQLNGKIVDIVNNYSQMSFNFGPTLLAWMEKKRPSVYEAILEADRISRHNFNGHGSAIAQVYNHMIMPLANHRDKVTQVAWGIADFQYRFQRQPEGMWLAETAADMATLEVLANHGIRFTVLSPFQAHAFRHLSSEWHDASGGRIDIRKPYVCQLPGGKSIQIVFYHPRLSQSIAFEKLLDNGVAFAQKIAEQFHVYDLSPQLVSIATDGETFGHHHFLGEMGLTYALHHIRMHQMAKVTIYGEYLEKFPPSDEVQIIEGSSWSCVHGIERWRSNCGCTTGGHPTWHQKWRKPLRDAFDWLRDMLSGIFEKGMEPYGLDPWSLRNQYIHVILNRKSVHVMDFMQENFKTDLDYDAKVKILKLLEMQYHSMLMYTSCGWFFEEVTGLETMQCILYAARALQLSAEFSLEDQENEFLERLGKATGNIPETPDAAAAYRQFVKPLVVDPLRVGAHYAISSLFSEYPEIHKIYSYTVRSDDYDFYEAGKSRLAIGHGLVHSDITWHEMEFHFAVLHLGEHQLFGGVREIASSDSYSEMRVNITDAFKKSNVHEMLFLMDRNFGSHNYSFWHLFRDDQKVILDKVLQRTISDVDGLFRQVYNNNYHLFVALRELKINLPRPFKITVDFMVNSHLDAILSGTDQISMKELRNVCDEIRHLGVELDEVSLRFKAGRRLEQMMQEFGENPENIVILMNITEIIALLRLVNLLPDLWILQNMVFGIRKKHFDDFLIRSGRGEAAADKWIGLFRSICMDLSIDVQ
jgi:alpha-amylase/alpha-mannosidase (GH57 family)